MKRELARILARMKMRKAKWGLSLFFVIVFFCRTTVDPRQDEPIPDQAKLKVILQKTRDYCWKLESAVFNFVCLEVIEEKVKNVQGSPHDFVPGWRDEGGIPRTARSIPRYELTGRTEKNRYLYEYQLIRKKMAFGPIDVLSGRGQLFYDYKIVKEELLNQPTREKTRGVRGYHHLQRLQIFHRRI